MMIFIQDCADQGEHQNTNGLLQYAIVGSLSKLYQTFFCGHKSYNTLIGLISPPTVASRDNCPFHLVTPLLQMGNFHYRTY